MISVTVKNELRKVYRETITRIVVFTYAVVLKVIRLSVMDV